MGDAQMNEVRCPVVELRQYTLQPGQRDVLIDLFDRELVETQEAAGMAILGQFRDLDEPDRFVWLRGFDGMTSRAQALARFYGGPAWKTHSAHANATMIDSDNVLLLRPATARSSFPAPAAARPPVSHTAPPTSRVLATLYYCDRRFDNAFMDFFDRQVRPVPEPDPPQRSPAPAGALIAMARTGASNAVSRAHQDPAAAAAGSHSTVAAEISCPPVAGRSLNRAAIPRRIAGTYVAS